MKTDRLTIRSSSFRPPRWVVDRRSPRRRPPFLFDPEPLPMSTDPSIPSDDSSKRYDRPSAVLGLVTLALVVATAWLRLGPGFWPAPPTVGSPLPPTRLERLQDDEQLLLLGVEGCVTWLVFLSAESVDGRAVLPQLEAVWKK